jgi:glutamate-1-semialdehyde 2,1-aminomutase
MRARLIREVVGSIVSVSPSLRRFCAEVMRRKSHDHHASHSNAANQILHIISSTTFLGCYALVFRDLTAAMWLGLAALFLRQLGHAVLEPPCHDKEATLLGYTTRSKTLILGAYLLIPAVHLILADGWSRAALAGLAPPVARDLFCWTLAVVGGRVAFLAWTHGLRLAAVWLVKLVTDPLTDIAAYAPKYLGVARARLGG